MDTSDCVPSKREIIKMSNGRGVLIRYRVFPAKSILECLLLYKLRDKEMQYLDTDDGA